jgi:membrane associated rhomboid family serine protease
MSYQEFRPRSFQALPPVIKNLLIINILMFATKKVLGSSLGIDLDNLLGLHYITATDFKPFQFITYLFMHGDFTHLFFNMFAVWMFGSVLENVWGSKRFLFYYLVTGMGAALIQYVVFHFEMQPVIDGVNALQADLSDKNLSDYINSESFKVIPDEDFRFEFQKFIREYNAVVNESPEKALGLASHFLIWYKKFYINSHIIIGASGALFGILLAFGMMFPNTLLYLYFVVPVKAKWFVIAYGVIELVSGISANPGDNVAHFAHLGGMLFGFIIMLFWKQKRDQFF